MKNYNIGKIKTLKILSKMTICFLALFSFSGCSGIEDNVGSGIAAGGSDIAINVRVDDTTGFLVMVNGMNDTSINNANGYESNPSKGLFAYNGYLYTTGSMYDDKLIKYTINDDRSLTLVAETTVYPGGGSIPSSIIFVNNTKAYLMLPGIGELVVFDPNTLAITNRIDLSPYAIDANGQLGVDDLNPEPSGGVIRNGKLYLSLAQIDSFSTYYDRGVASVLIIDASTDEVISHITDDRTSCSGNLSPNNGLILDENGDIYVNNAAAFGYYPGSNAGILRINNGEDEFDPSYYLSITDRTDLDVPLGISTYMYNYVYLENGELYTHLFIPGLTSNPPDYVNDKNYQPFVIDLWNQTITKLDMPPSSGWSSHLIEYRGDVIFGMSTDSGTGLFNINEDTPFVTTDGNPAMMANLLD